MKLPLNTIIKQYHYCVSLYFRDITIINQYYYCVSLCFRDVYQNCLNLIHTNSSFNSLYVPWYLWANTKSLARWFSGPGWIQLRKHKNRIKVKEKEKEKKEKKNRTSCDEGKDLSISPSVHRRSQSNPSNNYNKLIAVFSLSFFFFLFPFLKLIFSFLSGVTTHQIETKQKQKSTSRLKETLFSRLLRLGLAVPTASQVESLSLSPSLKFLYISIDLFWRTESICRSS